MYFLAKIDVSALYSVLLNVISSVYVIYHCRGRGLRMDRDVFIALADEIRPYLQPGRSPRGLDVLSVEKQLALTLYFLKDQGSLSMTANAFGIACCTELFLALILKYCLLIP